MASFKKPTDFPQPPVFSLFRPTRTKPTHGEFQYFPFKHFTIYHVLIGKSLSEIDNFNHEPPPFWQSISDHCSKQVMDLLFNILTDHVPKAVEVIRPHWPLIAVGIGAVVILKLLLSALTFAKMTINL